MKKNCFWWKSVNIDNGLLYGNLYTYERGDSYGRRKTT